jgi:hypothetical protein
MKNTFALVVICILSFTSAFSQSHSYVTTEVEMIFSFANIKDHDVSESSNLRWSPVLNLESILNRDMSQNFGLFSGIAIRNVGYIYDNYTNPADENMYKKKFRSYNLGIPIGIKVGDMDNLFFYGGYEVELPILYKEKTFDGEAKESTISGWFSTREKLFQHGLVAGVQFPRGMNVKFKYYLSEFHNQDYTDSSGIKPYSGLNSHVFYVSLNFILFHNKKYFTPLIPGTTTEYAYTQDK